MSWTHAYRLALHLLPAELRRKHGSAMETLFAREVQRARARGRRHETLAGAAGVWDVVWRGAYELARPARYASGAHGGGESPERWRVSADAPQPAASQLARLGGPHGGPHMSAPTTRQLLRRHAVSFAVALVALTATLLARYATKTIAELSGRGAPAGTIAEALVLALPFIVALTVPMAVFVAVLWEFTRLRADGALDAARRQRRGVRRLVVPVLAAAVAVATLTLGLNTAILPRANARLAAVFAGHPSSFRSDREMTVGELRAAARRARAEAEPQARALAANYEVEVQKKFALAAACVVLALAGMAVSLCVPRGAPSARGGAGLVIGASGVVFGAYYVLIMTGEGLAERLVVSPVVGMWGANALLLAGALLALLALWRRRSPVGPVGSPTVVMGG